MQLTGKTQVYGIIGYPVTHSLSPRMQNAAMQAAEIDGVYVPFEVAPENLPDAVAGMRALHISGFNVTIPHKTSIIPLLDELAPTAMRAGAVNTVVNHAGKLVGHNTDGDGLVRSLQVDLGCTLAGERVVLIGAGGASRGALAALCEAGVCSVVLLNRTLEAAELLLADFSTDYPEIQMEAYQTDTCPTPFLSQADLLINATSLGMKNEKIAGISLAQMSSHAKVYDMVYKPPVTPLLEEAQYHGLQAANGLGMLVGQGEIAFQLWHAQEPPPGLMQRVVRSL